MQDFESFKRIFPKSFVKKLKDSVIPFDKSINKKQILEELYNQIILFTYHPYPCRDYIIKNKHNYVARIIPSFYPKDLFLYYYCIKMLEDEIAKNRVEGTYGGWRLGNKIRFMEENDDYYLEGYAGYNSFNPFLWTKNWQDFQKKAYFFNKKGKYTSKIKLDIANFYNSINLHLLQKKIYLSVPTKKRFYVELLFHFLNNWNKKFEGYSNKLVGLPQEEGNDCSRILANFYLQDYDKFMKTLCDRNNATYLRYADDQIIYTNNKNTTRKILCWASKYLFKIGLDINSSKVIEFDNSGEFNKYWAFEIFQLFEDKLNKKKINKGIELFLSWKNENITFRENQVLKRILNLDFKLINPDIRHNILEILLKKEFLSNLDCWYFTQIYGKLKESEKEELLKILDSLIDQLHFNSYHYNLMKFYQKKKIPFDKERLMKAINKLKLLII